LAALSAAAMKLVQRRTQSFGATNAKMLVAYIAMEGVNAKYARITSATGATATTNVLAAAARRLLSRRAAARAPTRGRRASGRRQSPRTRTTWPSSCSTPRQGRGGSYDESQPLRHRGALVREGGRAGRRRGGRSPVRARNRDVDHVGRGGSTPGRTGGCPVSILLLLLLLLLLFVVIAGVFLAKNDLLS